jgi:hypothetical protein
MVQDGAMPDSSWRVDPHAARAVTARTRSEAASVIDALRAIRSALDEAGGVLSGTDSSDALHQLREDPFGIELRSVHDHVNDAAADVDASVAAYDDGDSQMATEVDAAAGGSLPHGRGGAR